MKWPRTLASRLALIFITGLVLAYGLSFSLQAYERYISSRSMMLSNLEQDVATSVAILDRLPAAERPAWLPRLERRTYRYRLDAGVTGAAMPSDDPPMAADSIVKAIGSQYRLTFQEIPGPNAHFQAHLRLADGAPLTIDVTPAPVPIATWLPLVLLIQLAVLLFCTWLAVRLAIGPLTRLVKALDDLDPEKPGMLLDESGPREVKFAAVAFNALQARIAAYLKERMQLLAAISHDLQTPITRMKLRVEVMDEGVEKDKLWHDLDAMEHLVREGVAYARSMDINTEPPCRINLDAFLDSVVFDYQDSGAQVERHGSTGSLLETRPHALRRVLVNLLDNALKFAGKAQLEVSREQGRIVIRVLDEGPGIPQQELGEVLKPFYRVESSRNRSTGGTGLGLAIAHQLMQAMGGQLVLSNRQGGGLCAQIELK
ncbi:HAMP domain-containing sensor histidine kinase [Pseudomonas sp. M5]|uniref:sensor histidine kinase n=1 Tax=Pseudomonas sp. M5 TaxID=1620788 RepID=UPI00195B7C27|nr:HAMP domain-containing sensor histidine kinase [Pseudomonas sp. M5]MBM7395440.1 signal transduction histidine kinase [Pseudomonas sp. M5]HDS1755533.1 HAMP domain-containing histidine kinase [Pseudomonas putida]